MLDDMNDVFDDVPLIEVEIVERPQRWTNRLQKNMMCVNCNIRLETLSNRKQNSCCGSNDSPHFFTSKRGHWERHVNQHVMRGDIYADDDMEFKL